MALASGSVMALPMVLAFFPEPGASFAPMASGWLIFGLYVLAGLLAGALCAYLAVGRGLAPVPWFFAGLVLNMLGLAAILTRPRGIGSEGGLPADIVPPGLRKVARTFSAIACPGCGSPQHPAAKKCSACGGPLNATATSDMSRA